MIRRKEAQSLAESGLSSAQIAKHMSISERTAERYLRVDKRFANDALNDKTPVLKKVLLVDIETAPMHAFVWGLWKQNVAPCQLTSDWYILSYAAAWLGDPETMLRTLPDDRAYVPGTEDDSGLLEHLWKLLDEADIVVAHNADRFDIPKINTRFLKHNMSPPSPYKVIDTLKIAKRHFKVSSNRLDYLGDFLDVGRKVHHEGFDLWVGCMKGDPASWKTMGTYNVGDITLLEQVYLKLAPWGNNLPSIVNEWSEKRCTCCGSEDLIAGGSVYTAVSEFVSFQCSSCGRWMRGAVNQKSKDEMRSTMRNIS